MGASVLAWRQTHTPPPCPLVIEQDDHQTVLIVACHSQMVNVTPCTRTRNLIVADTLLSVLASSKQQRANLLLLIGLSLGYFMVLLDTTIVNVALPAIGHDLGGGLSGLQWVVNAYTLVFASLLLTAGALADQFGAKRIFLIGLAIFLVASALSTVVPTLAVLIGLRALLGVGGALLLSPTLTLITHSFPDPTIRARATGMWASITGVALVAGPVAGGVLVDTLGWRSIFVINVPLALISFAVTLRLVRETPRSARQGLDLSGQLSSMSAMAALTFALIEGGVSGWQSLEVLVVFGIALILALFFLLVEARGRAPMLPLRLLANSTISTGMIAGLVINFGSSGILFVLSLFFQQARGYSALLAGLAFLPLTITIMLNATLTGRIVGRIGAKVPMTLGFFLAGCGVLLQAGVTMYTSYAVTLTGLLIMGIGVSLTLPSLLVAVMSAAPKELAGTASGALNASRQLGAVIGVAILGAILNESGGFIEGLHVALVVTGILLLGGGLLALLFVRRS